MLRKSFVLVPAIALMALTGVAHAETTPAKKALVAKLLQLQKPAIETLARNLAEQPASQAMRQAGLALQNGVAGDKREAVAKEIQADIKKYLDEAVPIVQERAVKLAPTTIGSLLDEKFTEAELKQIIATLESPVYRKFQQLGGDMQRSLTEKLVAETRPLIEPKVKELDQTLSRRLVIQGQPAPAPAAK